MYENDLFIIDLTTCSNTGEIINNISLAFETSTAKNKRIILKLQNVILNQSQLLSIQSLITSYGSTLDTIQTTSDAIKEVCEQMEINIEKMTEEEIKKEPTKEFDPIDIDFPATHDVSLELTEATETVPIENIEGEKNTIGVYKKAYDENKAQEDNYEEVNFYAPPTDEPVVIDTKKTIYVKQTLRSGQVLEYDGNIVIIGDCHPGSEVKATGDITVWGVLGSIAHAGMKGNPEARIRALKMNAVQLRIANCYSRRPDGTNIPYIIKSSVFMPEEARIVDDNIVLFKIN